jgi:hemerythrin-like domain-containing protein
MTTTAPTPVPQVLLPGQAAAPEGPVDMTLMYVMHHGFRRDLAAFAARVPTVAVDDAATWRALAERWQGFAHVLHNHHSGEDAGLWPLLLERVDTAGDAAGRATLEAMEAEHAEIDPLLEACARGFARMAEGGSADDRAALAVRTAAARDSLGRHLVHEESEAMVLLQRHLTQDDWEDVDRRFFKKQLTLAEVVFAVPWVCLGLPADVRERGFRAAGLGFRLVWYVTRRRFDRKQREAFGS